MSVKSFSSSVSRYSSNRASDLKSDAIKERKKAEQKQTLTTKSSWTPLASNTTLNQKLFLERKDLVCNWFDKWNDSQRKEILHLLIDKCTQSQRHLVDSIVHPMIPVLQTDFTKILPRCLVLYIFSFLDPRSLCRCAGVSWYFKYVSETDECWMPKCVKLGWWPSFQTTRFERGIWKHLFVETLIDLRNGRVPSGNSKFEIIEGQPDQSNKDNEALKKSQKDEKKLAKLREEKKTNNRHRPKIKQLYPLRSSNQQKKDDSIQRNTPSQTPKIDQSSNDGISDDNADIDKEFEKLNMDDNDMRPLWANKRNTHSDTGLGMPEPKPDLPGLFLQDIVRTENGDRNQQIQDPGIFSARPWNIPQEYSDPE